MERCPACGAELPSGFDLRWDEDGFLYAGANRVGLSPRQLGIVAALARAPGRPMSRESILDQEWLVVSVTDRTIDVHIRRLRQKLPSGILTTVRGFGYQWNGPKLARRPRRASYREADAVGNIPRFS